MTNKFVFKNNDLELDIAGNKFYVDTTDPGLIEKVLDFAKGAEVKAAELKGKEDYVEELKGTIEFTLDAIDSILEEGAVGKIFEGRAVGLFDALDVLSYIVGSINKGKEDKFLEYSPNRAARRSKK